jgi:UV DNA damage endonuclease
MNRLAPSRRTRTVRPQLGLVCMSAGDEVRFRTITRTRYLALSQADRQAKLEELYLDNLSRLRAALEFCRARRIRLYRAISGLFPMSDEPLGEQILLRMEDDLAAVGKLAQRYGIRVIQHPDQFVVLSSVSDQVVRQSIEILRKHALAFDLLGLPCSAWSAIILHGGKAGRAQQLFEVIPRLPENVRSRLVLENDEYAYSAREILEICHGAGVPMVFDAHHHAIREKLDSYEHPSVAEMTHAARRTWPKGDWQIVHLSNGVNSIADPRHSDLIHTVPSAFANAPWIEVEAKGKEQAIDELRRIWPLVR